MGCQRSQAEKVQDLIGLVFVVPREHSVNMSNDSFYISRAIFGHKLADGFEIAPVVAEERKYKSETTHIPRVSLHDSFYDGRGSIACLEQSLFTVNGRSVSRRRGTTQLSNILDHCVAR